MAVRYDFDEVVPRAGSGSRKWGLYPEDVIPAWIADMDFRCPEPVIRALHERVEHGIFGYTMPPGQLCEALADRLERLYGWRVHPDAILPIPSVDVAFNFCARAFCQPGDGELVQTPVYPPILRVSDYSSLQLHDSELVRGADGRYEIDYDAFGGAIRENTRLFLLCNPQNPTGRVFTRTELERLAEICLRHDLVICADEVHSDLIYEGHRHVPMASLSPEIERRTVTLMAPSKTFNVPGLKCALAIIPDTGLRERYSRAIAGVTTGIGLLGRTAAVAAYREGQEWLDQLLPYLQGNRDYLLDFCASRMPGISVSRPEGTYLAWLDCTGAGIPGDPWELFLKQGKVALENGAAFGRGGQGHVRLNFACPRTTLTEVLERMERAVGAVRLG